MHSPGAPGREAGTKKGAGGEEWGPAPLRARLSRHSCHSAWPVPGPGNRSGGLPPEAAPHAAAANANANPSPPAPSREGSGAKQTASPGRSTPLNVPRAQPGSHAGGGAAPSQDRKGKRPCLVPTCPSPAGAPWTIHPRGQGSLFQNIQHSLKSKAHAPSCPPAPERGTRVLLPL